MPIKEPKKPILRKEDVKWLRFRIKPKTNSKVNFDELIRIGGYANGNIFVGNIKFNNGVKQRVAIKIFNRHITNLDASEEQKKIDDLKAAGVNLPKMSMYLLPAGTKFGNNILRYDKWVLVSELFAKQQTNKFGVKELSSKIVNKSYFKFKDKETKIKVLIELAKVANAGYDPANDLIEPFKESNRIIPIDLDMIIKTSPLERALSLVDNIDLLFQDYSKTTKNKIIDFVHSLLNDEMKRAFITALKYREDI